MSSEENIESKPNPLFVQTYTCTPLVNQGNKDIERGGKVLLPVSALKEINDLDIPYPLIFKITNASSNKFSHAGVLEFTAEEGQVSIPLWMITLLSLKSGDITTVETVSLPSATHCSIEALTRNFAYVQDTKKLLENSLRYFSCLTEGDIFAIYDKSCTPNQIYKVKISQTKPESAVNIFECDLEIDYSVPVPKQVCNSKTNLIEDVNKRSVGFVAFRGAGYRLDQGTVSSISSKQKTNSLKKKFIAFNGTGNILQNQKRKCKENDVGPPEKKKKDDDTTNRPNELIFIREQQKEYLRTQSVEHTKFPGQGHSMTDN